MEGRRMGEIKIEEGLRILADWFDVKYPNDTMPEVQKDLRRWAAEIERLRDYCNGLLAEIDRLEKAVGLEKEYHLAAVEANSVLVKERNMLKERLKGIEEVFYKMRMGLYNTLPHDFDKDAWEAIKKAVRNET
jgi:archaellum component FlaC